MLKIYVGENHQEKDPNLIGVGASHSVGAGTTKDAAGCNTKFSTGQPR